MTKTEIADRLGISRRHLRDILNEKKSVSADVAARLGRALGNGTEIWLSLQAAHDAWHAERSASVKRIRKIKVARGRVKTKASRPAP